MILRIKSKVDKNGNRYGLIINTETKRFYNGFSIIHGSPDIHATKKEIQDLIDYNLKYSGFSPAISLTEV